MVARIDFYEKDNRIIETFNIRQLQEFGYNIQTTSYGLLLSKGEKYYPLTSWPLDNAKESEHEQDRMREPEPRTRPLQPSYSQPPVFTQTEEFYDY